MDRDREEEGDRRDRNGGRSGGPGRYPERRRVGSGTSNTILAIVTFVDEALWSRLSPLLDQVARARGRAARRPRSVAARARPRPRRRARAAPRGARSRPALGLPGAAGRDGGDLARGSDVRRLRARRTHRRGWHGDGLAGATERRPFRRRRRRQAPAPVARRGARIGALPQRGIDPVAPLPRRHRASLRRRRVDGRAAVPRPGARRRPADRPLRRRASTPGARPARALSPDRRRGRLRPLEPRRAPRPQALEHPRRPRRPRRNCSTSGSRRSSTRPPASRSAARSPGAGAHPRVCGAGAARRGRDHHRHRCLRPRRAALRAADRQTSGGPVPTPRPPSSCAPSPPARRRG